jgi:predicted DNA-binding protein
MIDGRTNTNTYCLTVRVTRGVIEKLAVLIATTGKPTATIITELIDRAPFPGENAQEEMKNP